jgi:hypothetical protein
LVIGVKAPAAIAEQRPARTIGKQFTERRNAILQRHAAALPRFILRAEA